MNADDRKGILYVLLGNTIFGLSFLFSKQALAVAPLMVVLMWRFVLAFVCMTALRAAGVIHMNFSGKPLKKLIPVVIAQPVIYFVVEAIGISRTSSSVAGIMVATSPVIVYVMAWFFLKERLSRGQLLGVLLSIAGVSGIILLDGFQPDADWVGIVCMLLAMLTGSAYNIMVRGISREIGALEITYAMMAVGAACFSALAVVQCANQGNIAALVEPFAHPQFLLAVVYLGILASVVAYFAINKALPLLGAGRTSAFANLTTVISMAAGVVVLGERLQAYHLVGAAMILVGVWWAERAGQRGRVDASM
jgi:drug/metabolite transporter (DMT)-like permease